jgi:hypothetical protein
MTASAPLDLSGFTFPMVAPTDTIDSVTAAVNGWVSDLAMGPLAYELHDGISGALLGSAAGTASTSPAHIDTVIFGPPAWAQLHWLHLRITAGSGTAPPGAVASVDYVALSVTYLSAGIPFAAPVCVTPAAAGTAPDASGPRGRLFIDVTVFAGPTSSRSQVSAAGTTVSDGTAAAPLASRAAVSAGNVSVRAPLGAGV